MLSGYLKLKVPAYEWLHQQNGGGFHQQSHMNLPQSSTPSRFQTSFQSDLPSVSRVDLPTLDLPTKATCGDSLSSSNVGSGQTVACMFGVQICTEPKEINSSKHKKSVWLLVCSIVHITKISWQQTLKRTAFGHHGRGEHEQANRLYAGEISQDFIPGPRPLDLVEGLGHQHWIALDTLGEELLSIPAAVHTGQSFSFEGVLLSLFHVSGKSACLYGECSHIFFIWSSWSVRNKSMKRQRNIRKYIVRCKIVVATWGCGFPLKLSGRCSAPTQFMCLDHFVSFCS